MYKLYYNISSLLILLQKWPPESLPLVISCATARLKVDLPPVRRKCSGIHSLKKLFHVFQPACVGWFLGHILMLGGINVNTIKAPVGAATRSIDLLLKLCSSRVGPDWTLPATHGHYAFLQHLPEAIFPLVDNQATDNRYIVGRRAPHVKALFSGSACSNC